MNPVLQALMGPAAGEIEAASQRRYLALARQQDLSVQLADFDSEHGEEIQQKQFQTIEAAKQVSDLEDKLERVNRERSKLFPLKLKQGSLVGKIQRWFNQLCCRALPMLFPPDQIEFRTLTELRQEEDSLRTTIREVAAKLARARAHRQHSQEQLGEFTAKRDRIAAALASEAQSEDASIKQIQDQMLDRIAQVDIRFLAASLGHCQSASPKVIRDILRLRHQRRLNQLIQAAQSRVAEPAAFSSEAFGNSIASGFSESEQRSAIQLRLSGRRKLRWNHSVPLLAYALAEDFLKASNWNADHLAKALAQFGFENFKREANAAGIEKIQDAKAADTQSFADLLQVTGLQKNP